MTSETCANCEYYTEFNGKMVCSEPVINQNDMPFLVDKEYSCENHSLQESHQSETLDNNICANCGHKNNFLKSYCERCGEKFKHQKSDFQKEIEQDAKRLNEIYDKHQNHSSQIQNLDEKDSGEMGEHPAKLTEGAVREPVAAKDKTEDTEPERISEKEYSCNSGSDNQNHTQVIPRKNGKGTHSPEDTEPEDTSMEENKSGSDDECEQLFYQSIKDRAKKDDASSLSDKRIDMMGYTKRLVKQKYYWEKDVKEFVKKLKDELDIVLISEADKHKAKSRIDKIFGSALI